MTTPLGAATSTGSPAGTAATPPGGALGKDAFMQLLVAQMRYQNPLSPVDGQQYMAQLAQFAQVEKLEAVAKAQSELQLWQKNVAGQAMLGQVVAGTDHNGIAQRGEVTGVVLTSTGPRLQLSGGGTLGVDQVVVVEKPLAPATSTTAPPASPSS